MTASPAQSQALKAALHATWAAGDYGIIARGLEASAGAFLDRHLKGDTRVLDVACGSGQLAIPAARAGADAVGIDIAEPWISQARERARSEGLTARFDVGDVEGMPYDDSQFDLVISLIGAMFAPRPEVAATEMLRVCRPGGRVVMGNWTPEGFVGDFFRTVARHKPPPDMPSPLLWGKEDVVTERFGDRVTSLSCKLESLHFDYPMPPGELADHYLEHFGPARKAAESLDPENRQALRDDLERLWESANRANDGTTQVDAEILEVVAIKA